MNKERSIKIKLKVIQQLMLMVIFIVGSLFLHDVSRAEAPNDNDNVNVEVNEQKLKAGKKLYRQSCQTCHTLGLLNAPKLGSQADWTPRLKHPMNEIYHNALYGKGNMPPKGGAIASDAEVKAAVDYMLQTVK